MRGRRFVRVHSKADRHAKEGAHLPDFDPIDNERGFQASENPFGRGELFLGFRQEIPIRDYRRSRQDFVPQRGEFKSERIVLIVCITFSSSSTNRESSLALKRCLMKMSLWPSTDPLFPCLSCFLVWNARRSSSPCRYSRSQPRRHL